jgi:lipoprotein-anchoring transpeptidase ErfK/SrfK
VNTPSQGVAVAAAAIAAAAIAIIVWPHSASAPPAQGAVGLPSAPKPAFVVPRPVGLSHAAQAWYWASIRSPVAARAAPSASALAVADLATTTPEGTTNIVLVLGRRIERKGRIWVHVRLPVLPNEQTGWLPRRALGVYGVVHTHLVVDLGRLTATLLRDGRPLFRAPIGAGRPGWPTPRGEFYVRNRLTKYRSPFYGPIAFGTSARSTVLTDWPGGGFVGIHGTDAPSLLPGRVSHGCIRLRNRDILELAKLMPVGTPVTVR